MTKIEINTGWNNGPALKDAKAQPMAWTEFNALAWEAIPPTQLPVILFRFGTPEAVVCANKTMFQEQKIRTVNVGKDGYLMAIKDIMPISNLKTYADLIERDRKFKRPTKRLPQDLRLKLIRDIAEKLNRSMTEQEMCDSYKVTKSMIMSYVHRMRLEGFNIPTAKGQTSEISMIAAALKSEGKNDLFTIPLVAQKRGKVEELKEKKEVAVAKNGH